MLYMHIIIMPCIYISMYSNTAPQETTVMCAAVYMTAWASCHGNPATMIAHIHGQIWQATVYLQTI